MACHVFGSILYHHFRDKKEHDSGIETSDQNHCLIIIVQYIDFHETTVRLFSLYKPSAILEQDAALGKRSYELRKKAIVQAVQGWLISPIIGVGVGNTGLYVERLTHNDYATILLELGLLGELLFLGILITVWRRTNSRNDGSRTEIHWLSLAARAGFITLVVCLNFYNLYRSPYFWFYLALFIVTLETVEGKAATKGVEARMQPEAVQ